MDKRVSILSFSPIASDARVLRQMVYLSRRYAVDVIGYGDNASPPDLPVRMRPLRPSSRSRPVQRARTLALLSLMPLHQGWASEGWYWRRPEHNEALALLLGGHPSVIHANDVMALPVAVRASRETGAAVVLDLHEYAPLEMEHLLYWRLTFRRMTEYFLREYMPSVSASVTVNRTIADRYADEHGFRPIVVLNAPERDETVGFRPTDPARIRLVHHGGAMPGRRLELMVEALARTDSRYSLHFMLVGNPRYVERLRDLGQRLAPGRVFFHPPVPPRAIVRRIAEFDMGIFVLPPVNYNWHVALPNKFLDFIHAGLAVCVGPSPEMARLAGEHGFGTIAPSFDPAAVAETLDRLTPAEIDRMKRNALQARNVLNADVEMGKLLALYEQVLDQGRTPPLPMVGESAAR